MNTQINNNLKPIPVDPDQWFEFPADVATCPICGGHVVAFFDEWEEETGKPTEAGFHIDCKDEPDEEGDEYDDWLNAHWSTPYIDWLPLEGRLYRWFVERYRIADRGEE